MLGAVLLFPVLTVPVFASNTQPCDGQDGHVGTYRDRSGWTARGVRATFDTNSAFDICSHNLGDDDVSVYVSIEAGAESPWYGQGGIIQFGALKCNSLACLGENADDELTLFYAIGGCGQPAVTKFIYGALGPGAQISDSPHTYTLRKEASAEGSDYLMFIDGILAKEVSNTAAAIACWQDEDKMAGYWGEYHDGGNSFGTSTNPLRLDNGHFQSTINGAWQSPGWTGGLECGVVEDSSQQNHRCVTDGTLDGFDMWSVNK